MIPALKKIRFIFFIGFSCLLNAQTQEIIVPDNSFDHISTKDGLSSSNVNQIIKDNDGFLWLATQNGLNRYDGTNFKTFKYDPEEKNSINHNNVSCLVQSPNGILWIGTLGGGLNRYDLEKGRFNHFISDGTGLTNDFVTSLALDQLNQVWIGTRKGVHLLNQETQKIEKVLFDSVQGPEDEQISTLAFDDEQNLWIGTASNGVYRYNPLTGEITSFPMLSMRDPENFYLRIFSIAKISDGPLIIGTGAGIAQFNPTTQKFEPFTIINAQGVENTITDRAVLYIAQDPHGRLWIGTWLDGLYIVDRNTNTVHHYLHNAEKPKSLGQNRIRSIFLDGNQYAWLCTYTDGVNRYDFTQQFFPKLDIPGKVAQRLNQSSIGAICKDRQGIIWAGSLENGLFRIDRQKKVISHFDKNDKGGQGIIDNEILAIHETSDGRVWFGTSNGLMYFDQNAESFKRMPLMNKENTIGSEVMIFCIAEDKNGNLWMGTRDQGLLQLNKTTGLVERYRHWPDNANSLSTDYIRSILIDRNGMIWAGTKLGLNRMNPETGDTERFQHDSEDAQSLSGNFVESLFKDGDGFLWVGTHGSGLNKLVGWRDASYPIFKHYDERDGLPNDVVTGILPDGPQQLWLSTAQGLCHFDTQHESFVQYWLWDGLNSAVFNPGAYFKSEDNELFFGTSHGFEAFYPDNIPNLEQPPKLLLTDFKVHNKTVVVNDKGPLKQQINATDTIVLGHWQSAFSFNFTALNYSHGSDNKYAYTLEGLDEDWNYVGNRNEAVYTNISPGTYTFKVKAADHHNIWNQNPRQVLIQVKPPAWKTFWAYCLYAFLLGVMFWWARKQIIARERLKNVLRMERQQHEIDLKQHELDEMKVRFFTNISHEIRTPLTLILGPIRKLLGTDVADPKRGNTYRMVYRNAQRLYQLVTQLMDTTKLESGQMKLRVEQQDVIPFIRNIVLQFQDMAEHTGKELLFSADPAHFEGWFDADKLKKILFNLLSNAIKFTPPGGRISVETHIEKKAEGRASRLMVKVSDTGIGIEKEELGAIFDYFHQSFPKTNQEETSGDYSEPWDGTGIGLALSKQLAHVHKGSLGVESEPGKGSTFKIIVPVDGEAYSDEEKRKSVTTKDTWLEPMEEVLHDAWVPVEMNVGEGRPVVLVVEDNEDMRKFILQQLVDDFQVLEAKDGEEGMHLALESIPDLIISDLMMPQRNGIELAQILKNDQRTSHIPIIILTAIMRRKEHLAGYRSGADDYITKPFDGNLLRAKVLQLIASRKRLRESFSKGLSLNPKEVTFNSADEEFLEKIIELIEEHMSDSDFDISVFSKEMYMSRSQLYRKIRALTDQTPIELVRMLRLKRAAQMLKSDNFTAAEVGYSVGFKTPAHFSRCFKEHFKISPAKYAKSVVVAK